MTLVIRQPTKVDAISIAANMRDADLREIEAFSGRKPYDVLVDGIYNSDESYVALVDGELLAIWGVAQGVGSVLTGKIGVGWLLTTKIVEQHKRLFWRECKWILVDLLSRWDALVNTIDCRHEKALRWASKLGFWLDESRPTGESGLPFRPFVITKERLNV